MSVTLLEATLKDLQTYVSDRNSGWDIKWDHSEGKWAVEVEEADDHHQFVAASSYSTDKAALAALKQIPKSLEFWGWEDVFEKGFKMPPLECDSAIGHGPGHQSISECIYVGHHTSHYSDMGHEWEDSDIGTQVVRKLGKGDDYKTPYQERTGPVYRLAFDPY